MKTKSFENIDAAIAKGYHVKLFKRFDDKIQATIGFPRSMEAGHHSIGATMLEAMRNLDRYLNEISL